MNKHFKVKSSLSIKHPTYEARVKYLERKKEEEFDSISSFEKNKAKKKENSKRLMRKSPAAQIPETQKC